MDFYLKMKLKMGIVEGVFYDEFKIVEMVNILLREVFIVKLFGSLKVLVLNFVYLIDVIVKKVEG